MRPYSTPPGPRPIHHLLPLAQPGAMHIGPFGPHPLYFDKYSLFSCCKFAFYETPGSLTIFKKCVHTIGFESGGYPAPREFQMGVSIGFNAKW
ncbi:hypothetical protein GGU45_002194 [Niabella hirudinis]